MNKQVKPDNLLQQDSYKDYSFALIDKLRNPVDNIHLSIEMLRVAANANDQEIYLDVIIRSAGRIDHAISSFLIDPS